MKTINGRSYAGVLKGKHHTLKQMRDFLSRSKGENKIYWHARIEELKLDKSKFKSLFKNYKQLKFSFEKKGNTND